MVGLPLRALLLLAALALAAAKSSYYEVLGVAKDATAAEVKKAYRRLALKWHPDKSTEPDAAERFREVAEAYEVLGDAGRRRDYDAGGEDLIFSFDFTDANEIFKAFFGDEDPFAGIDKMFSDLQWDMDQHMAGAQTVQETGSSESGGFFSAISSFVSSFTSSFSSNDDGGDVKVMHRTTETRIGPDGHKVTKTVESDGGRTQVTAEDTSRMAGTVSEAPPDIASPAAVSESELHAEQAAAGQASANTAEAPAVVAESKAPVAGQAATGMEARLPAEQAAAGQAGAGIAETPATPVKPEPAAKQAVVGSVAVGAADAPAAAAAVAAAAAPAAPRRWTTLDPNQVTPVQSGPLRRRSWLALDGSAHRKCATGTR
uniref:J domain-containing protein n=1 Tax=Alexandrium monilatum TaxID=311494 RepID=A0A7S4QJF9_9DINO